MPARVGRTCEVCSDTYRANYADQRTCGRECGLVARFGWPASPLRIGSCPGCGSPFVVRAGKAFCGPACRPSRYVPRTGLRLISCPNHETSLWFAHHVIGRGDLPRSCPSCRRRADAEWRRTAKAVRRARLRGARVERVVPSVVFDRDGWICGLCASPVERSALVPALLAPTVDHIVPLARGGEHSYANIQCAHFICNSRKRDEVAS